MATNASSIIFRVSGEIDPTSIGLGNATCWSLEAAGLLTTVERLSIPVVVVFDWITRRMNAVLGGV